LLRKTHRHRAISLDAPRNGRGDGSALLGELENKSPGPVATLEAQEQREQVRQAVQRLPEHQRVTLNLIYFQGLQYREAAELLHVPIGTVKTRVRSARARLRPMAKAS
jgi:RNA polymerase sigma-70 factor (ECF subfamily)